MKRLFILLSLLMSVGCGTEHPLSRGESGFPAVNDGFSKPGGGPSEQDFNEVILPFLDRDCTMCHSNFAPDYASALELIEEGVPSSSVLYQVSIGVGHRKVWSPDRPEAEALAKWIRLEDLD